MAVVAPFALAKTEFSTPSYVACFSYAVFYAVYRLPHVDLDRFGDISYGVYIYAWPVQQLVWTPGQSGYANAALATLIVIPVAYLSWRLVEKPALNLRRIFNRKLAPPPKGGPRSAVELQSSEVA